MKKVLAAREFSNVLSEHASKRVAEARGALMKAYNASILMIVSGDFRDLCERKVGPGIDRVRQVLEPFLGLSWEDIFVRLKTLSNNWAHQGVTVQKMDISLHTRIQKVQTNGGMSVEAVHLDDWFSTLVFTDFLSKKVVQFQWDLVKDLVLYGDRVVCLSSKSLSVFDVTDGVFNTPVHQLDLEGGYSLCVTAEYIGVAGETGVRIYSPQLALLSSITEIPKISSLALRGRTLAAGSEAGLLFVYKDFGNPASRVFVKANENGSPLTHLVFINSDFVCSASGGDLKVWTLELSHPLEASISLNGEFPKAHSSEIKTLALVPLPDGSRQILVTSGGSVKVWEFRSKLAFMYQFHTQNTAHGGHVAVCPYGFLHCDRNQAAFYSYVGEYTGDRRGSTSTTVVAGVLDRLTRLF